MCNDPVRRITTVLLTNRVYPKADAESSTKVHKYRQKYNNAVKDAFDSLPTTKPYKLSWKQHHD